MTRKLNLALALAISAIGISAQAADQYFMRVPAPAKCAGASCVMHSRPLAAPATPETPKPSNPAGYFTPVTNADFGKIQVGASASRQFTFTNTGTGPLTNAYVSASGSGFTMGAPSVNTCGLPSRKVTIAPGATCKAVLSFSPKALGSQSGALTLNSIDLVASAPTYAATGAGGQALPVISDNVKGGINFGTVSVGMSASATFTLTNQGDVSLSVQRNRIGKFSSLYNDQEVLQYTWMSWANGYVTDTCPSAGADTTSLAPGQTCSFTVTLAPTKAGSFNDWLNIQTSGGTISLPMVIAGQ
jgi:hypothetical protein